MIYILLIVLNIVNIIIWYRIGYKVGRKVTERGLIEYAKCIVKDKEYKKKLGFKND